MENADKLKRLSELSDEAELREILLKPLFVKLEFQDVTIVHGAQEDGKDIVFWEIDRFQRPKWTACVVKHGDITGAASGKKSLGEVNEQVRQALEIPFPDPRGKRQVRMDRVVVIASGRISTAALGKVAKMFEGRSIDFIQGDDLVGLIDRYWPRYWDLRNPVLAEYFDVLQAQIESFLDLRTLGCSTNRAFRKVFVDVSLDEVVRRRSPVGGRRHQKGKGGIDSKPKRIRSTELRELPGGHLILGEGGSGKSCVLRNLALEQIAQNRERAGAGRLPVMLHARALVDRSVKASIESTVELPGFAGHLPIDPDDAIGAGQLLMLIDGYDEVSEERDRERVAQAVEQFLKESPRSVLVMASREIDDFEFAAKLPSLKQYRVVPFSFAQVRQFMANWFSEGGTQEKLQREIADSDFLEHVPNTPLVLTMLAIVLEKKENKELPANVTDLFQMYSELMLGKWDVEAHKLETLIEYNVCDRVLCAIAERMAASRTLQLDRGEVISVIDGFLRTSRLEGGANASSILEFLEDRACLLSDIGGDAAFRHHSIQSFFCARQWVHGQINEAELVDRFLDPWWAEAIFYYSGTRKQVPRLIELASKVIPSTLAERLHKIVSLGGVVQAAYITDYELRKAAVRDSVSSAFQLYREFAEFAGAHPEHAASKLPRVMVLLICLDIFSRHFSSRTLREALEECLAECVEDNSEESVFLRYALARCLGSIGVSEHLVALASKIPAGLVRWQLAAAIDLQRLTDGKGKPAKEAIAKVRRRIKSGQEQLKAELDEPIVKTEQKDRK